jgi:hypothetical protein
MFMLGMVDNYTLITDSWLFDSVSDRLHLQRCYIRQAVERHIIPRILDGSYGPFPDLWHGVEKGYWLDHYADNVLVPWGSPLLCYILKTLFLDSSRWSIRDQLLDDNVPSATWKVAAVCVSQAVLLRCTLTDWS